MEVQVENSNYANKAIGLFQEGYNCSQSVFLAFEDLYEVDSKSALMLSSSFGGGMGRLREVCGAVTGMFMVSGLLYGYDSPKDDVKKKEHYERIQYLAQEFQSVTGTIICRELLELPEGKDEATPSTRTKEYYEKRPCGQLVGIAAAILEQYIKEN